MTDVLGHDFALVSITRPGTTWANNMNFVINRAPGAGSIVRPVEQQYSALPLPRIPPMS